VIFVDNGSTDGSIEFVKKNYPNVQIFQNKHNLGVGTGFNLGIVNAKGKYVATLNNDIEVDPQWLLPLVKFMESYSDVAIVDAKYLNYYNRKRFDTQSAAGRYLDFLANPLTLGAGEEDRGQYDKISRVFYSCTLYRRDVLIDVGMFDEDFFYWYEDSDLGWRINLKGYHVMYIPTSRIYHKGGETKFQQNQVNIETKLRHGFYFLNKRNKLLTLIKNYSTSTLIKLLPLIFFEHIGYIVYWTVKHNKQYSIESTRAVLWIIKNFKKAWDKHLQIQLLRKIKDKDIRSLMAPYFGDPVKLIGLIFAKRKSYKEFGRRG
jgi:hypothetical protein